MFKIRPYDRNRENKQTTAQRAATEKNFRIFRLRGLWSQAGLLAEPYATAARVAIDADLRERGAEPERQRQARLQAESERQYVEECAHRLGVALFILDTYAARLSPYYDDLPF